MSYRVENAKSGRAGCKHGQCADKIDKGALRLATYVKIQDRVTPQWRHWGCVTAAQLQNIKKSITVDGEKTVQQGIDYLDGYDEVDGDSQEKIIKAIEQGYVDDQDWRHDAGGNRETGRKGRKKTQKSESEEKDVKEVPNEETLPEARAQGKPAKREPVELPESPKKSTNNSRIVKSEEQDSRQPEPTKTPDSIKRNGKNRNKSENSSSANSREEKSRLSQQSRTTTARSEPDAKSGVTSSKSKGQAGTANSQSDMDETGQEPSESVGRLKATSKASGRAQRPPKEYAQPTRVSARNKAAVAYKDVSDEEIKDVKTEGQGKSATGADSKGSISTKGTKRKNVIKKDKTVEESTHADMGGMESEEEQPKKKRGRPPQTKKPATKKKTIS